MITSIMKIILMKQKIWKKMRTSWFITWQVHPIISTP